MGEDTPAAAPSGAQAQQPAAETDDSIIGDILKGGKPPPEPDEEPADDGSDEPEPPEAAADDDGDDSGDTAEADDAADEGEDDAADPEDGGELTEQLKAARKALGEGDVDKAFAIAFGRKPEEVQPDAKVWTKWRAANQRAQQAIERERQVVQTQLQQGQQWVAEQRQQLQAVIAQLRPYEEIHQARLAFKQSGDPSALVKLVELTAEMPYDEAQKLILTKTRRSPGERALQQQVQSLMQRLEEAERKKTEEAQQQTQQQVYQNDLATIRQQLSGDVTKVPRFDERVYRVLVETRLPTGGLSMTVEEAGRRVLAAERRKLAKHPLLGKQPLKDPKVSKAAATLAKARKGKTAPVPPLRRDSRGNGATDESTESTEDIISDILKSNNRRRVAV